MKAKFAVAKIKTNDVKTPLVVGGVRNEHGTRICRKVVCQKCQNTDYISVSRSKREDALFCRKCAGEEMRLFERGTRVAPELIAVKCEKCSKAFDFPKWIQKKGPVFCSDCHQGFEVWRGSLETPVQERSSVAILRRPAGTLLRTKSTF